MNEQDELKKGISHIENMVTAIYRLQAENDALREQNRWIPVTERLPEDYEKVLFNAKGVVYRGHHILDVTVFFNKTGTPSWVADNEYDDDDLKYGDVTQWMNLPEPPQEV